MLQFHEIFAAVCLLKIACFQLSFSDMKILFFTSEIFFQVKINGQNEEMLRAAIEQFGDKTDDEIAFGKNIYIFLKFA